MNDLVEYDCFKSFRLKRLHGNHALEYFKPRASNLAKKWNSTTTTQLYSLLKNDLQRSVLTVHGHLLKSLECFHRCLNMSCFIHHWKNKLKLDWVHISADRKTYLVSLIESSVFQANGVFEVYLYIKILSKFYTSLFSKTYLRDKLGSRLLGLFELKDSGEAFCCSPSDQRNKDHCRRR